MPNVLFFSLAGFAILILILVILDRIYKKMLIPVDGVDAGTNDFHTKMEPVKSSISPFESFYNNGKRVNPKDYIVRVVNGNCMIPKGIYSGDLLFIDKFNGNVNSLSEGDILFIKYEKDGHSGYKIREYKGREKDGKLHTIYYEDDKPKNSSILHDIKNVEGKIKMKFAGLG